MDLRRIISFDGSTRMTAGALYRGVDQDLAAGECP